MEKCNIVDNRKSFTRLSFSNHKKQNVLQELTESLYYKKRDDALHWTAEMLCSGYISDLWKIYIMFYCKYIHMYNIKIPIYVSKKLEEYKKIQANTDIKNNDELRAIFFTITIIYCETKNEHTLTSLPFTFHLDKMYDHLKADHVDYIKPFFKEQDPKEFYIPLNEFVYHLEHTKDKTSITYWLDWLIEYDIYLTKKKKNIYIQARTDEFKDDKKNRNIIWIIWEILRHNAKNAKELVQQSIDSLFDLFKIKYTLANNKTYKGVLYVVVQLITTDVNVHIKLIENVGLFKHLHDNTQIIFNEIKKKEVWVEETKTPKQKLFDTLYAC